MSLHDKLEASSTVIGFVQLVNDQLSETLSHKLCFDNCRKYQYNAVARWSNILSGYLINIYLALTSRFVMISLNGQVNCL